MGYLARRGFRPLEALRALHALNRDHDDTAQVFRVIEALRGLSRERALARFRAHPLGARVLRDGLSLVPPLADRGALAELPGGTLGRAYLDFMEAQGISAEGLAGASADSWVDDGSDRDMETFRAWSRDQHDLWHVVTAYGPDPLGELCLLAFTTAQYGSPGTGLIAAMGALRYAGARRDPRIARAVWEGWRRGRRARWLPVRDWEVLLAEPLDGLRRRLRIAPPVHYAAARASMPAWPRAALLPA